MTIKETLLQIKNKRKNYLISYTINGSVFSNTLNSLVKIKFSENISPASNCHSIEIEDFNQLNDILVTLDFHNSIGVIDYLHKKYMNLNIKSKKYLIISYLNLDNFQFGC